MEHKCPFCGVTLAKEGEWYYCRTVECITLEVHKSDLFMLDALNIRLKTPEDEKKIEFAEAARPFARAIANQESIPWEQIVTLFMGYPDMWDDPKEESGEPLEELNEDENNPEIDVRIRLQEWNEINTPTKEESDANDR